VKRAKRWRGYKYCAPSAPPPAPPPPPPPPVKTWTQGPLAGGFSCGDSVVAQFDKPARNITFGTPGIVIGPSRGTSADKECRVCVNFGDSRGLLNVLVTSQISRYEHPVTNPAVEGVDTRHELDPKTKLPPPRIPTVWVSRS